MSVFRPLLYIVLLLIGNAISALPESYGHSLDSIEEASQANDQKKDHPFFDVDKIKSENSIQVEGRFRPNIVFSNMLYLRNQYIFSSLFPLSLLASLHFGDPDVIYIFVAESTLNCSQ